MCYFVQVDVDTFIGRSMPQHIFLQKQNFPASINEARAVECFFLFLSFLKHCIQFHKNIIHNKQFKIIRQLSLLEKYLRK